MATSKNALKCISDFYANSVKREDSKGFSDLYVQATQEVLSSIEKEFRERGLFNDLSVHFEDIAYGDGYYIFGMGTNSVVHFRIKETPGWLYGIWWSPIETEETKNKKKKEYYSDKVTCTFFMQHESLIDKFKPSYSVFCNKFIHNLACEDSTSEVDDVCGDIAFIIKEPYLAFYKDLYSTNFNHEYVSREKAKKVWDKYWKEKHKEEELSKTCAQKVFDTLKTILKDDVKHGYVFIVDRGDYISPRYDVIIKNIKLDDGERLVNEPGGYYTLMGKQGFYEDTDDKLYGKAIKECEKIKKKTWFDNPFSNSCLVLDPRAFNNYYKESINEGCVLFGYKEGQFIENAVKYNGE